MRKLITPAIVAFIIFLIATQPATAANLGEMALAGLGSLATGAADVLTSWAG